jgi:uracil-DNA glycosylase family 4
MMMLTYDRSKLLASPACSYTARMSKPENTPNSALPDLDCPLCPRLVGYRYDNQAAHPDWFNAPVPCFGDENAALLIVGLAPGVTGANRTGRPFTGDWAGDLLYETLANHGFSRGTYDKHIDDGLELENCMITNAVRCVPPQNKPIGAEITACRPFLQNRIASMPNLKAILSLGRISHESVLRGLGVKLKDAPFGHAAKHEIGAYTLYDSYHCSRYNTNTRRLTPDMFAAVFAQIRDDLANQ